MNNEKYMYCPKCGCEYHEGFIVCNDCNVSLVPTKPEAAKEEEDVFASQGWVKLLDNTSDFEADMVISMLKYYSIEAKKFYKSDTHYISLFMGSLNSGVYVIVKKLQYQDAKDILNSEADYEKLQDPK